MRFRDQVIAHLKSGAFVKCKSTNARETNAGDEFCVAGALCQLYSEWTGIGYWEHCYWSDDLWFNCPGGSSSYHVPATVRRFFGITREQVDELIEINDGGSSGLTFKDEIAYIRGLSNDP